MSLKINYKFKDEKLLRQALTHSSSVTRRQMNNERLEFLGDRVLGVIVADLLYKKFCNESEGDLAKRHAVLVCAKSLALVGERVGLYEVVRVSRSLEAKKNKNVLADAMEAVIGAVYLDGGFKTVFDLVSELWKDLIEEAKEPPQDFKTLLQEATQADTKELPEYEVLGIAGPDHKPKFQVKVSVGDVNATGEGRSKKVAEQDAAKEFLKIMGKFS